MDRSLTVSDIMQMNPCYPYSKVEKLWAGRESLTPLEVLDLDIPIQDRFWAVLRPDVIGERTCRILACDFAGHVLPIFERLQPGDLRPRQAIETAIRYLDGKATDSELAAAKAAAGAAAWPAAWDAAGAAAWPAAGAAARAASRAAADTAADATAQAAAEASEYKWQLSRVRQLLSL